MSRASVTRMQVECQRLASMGNLTPETLPLVPLICFDSLHSSGLKFCILSFRLSTSTENLLKAKLHH